jgi:hypothetical protein
LPFCRAGAAHEETFIKPQKQRLHLLPAAERQLAADVYPAWPEQRIVELCNMIGGHEEELAFLRRDPVNCVKEP